MPNTVFLEGMFEHSTPVSLSHAILDADSEYTAEEAHLALVSTSLHGVADTYEDLKVMYVALHCSQFDRAVVRLPSHHHHHKDHHNHHHKQHHSTVRLQDFFCTFL
jgi:hypothetical protein